MRGAGTNGRGGPDGDGAEALHVRPVAFKVLVGRGHDEFSSARQQVGLPPAAVAACNAAVPVGARHARGSPRALCVRLFRGRRYNLGESQSIAACDEVVPVGARRARAFLGLCACACSGVAAGTG